MFSPDDFGELSTTYVLNAVRQGQELRRRELHEQELGIANLAALTANINRDPKKTKSPYRAVDFCYFADKEDLNNPDAINAAAYLKLLEDKNLPAWALFCYPQMKGMDDGVAAPNPVAAIGDGFVLLAPQPANGGMEGLLIAENRVAGQKRRAHMGRQKLWVTVPEFTETVIAREHMFVAVA